MKALYRLLLVLFLVLVASCTTMRNVEAYMHDPLDNPQVLRDTVKEPGNVFGFAPAKRDKEHPNSTLHNFAGADFASFAKVGYYRQQRIDYHEYVVERLDAIMAQNISLEEKARAAVKVRNDARLAAYLDKQGKVKPGMESGYQAAVARAKKNTYEYFHNEKKLSDEEIFQSAYGSNAGMDAVLGLYDRYFSDYKILVPSRVIKGLNPEEKQAYDRLYAKLSHMSLKQREQLSYLYFMEPEVAAKLIVHLVKWYKY